MLSIGICDDESAICSELERIIRGFQAKMTETLNTTAFSSGQKLIECIKNGHTFDLLFLDIELGAVNGIEIGRMIREEMEDYIAKIVYITSKDGYDRQLFDVQPFKFLPKPLDPNKVFECVSLAIKQLIKGNDVYTFKIGYETYRIPIKEILYFECEGRMIKLVGVDDTFQYYGKIDDIINSLSMSRFIYPHRSYFINFDHTKIIGSKEIVMSNGDRIFVSKRKSKEIRNRLIAFEEER